MTNQEKRDETPPPSGNTRAEKNIAWIEKYCWVPQGKFVGERIWLREWQQDLIHDIYDGKTRNAIISFGRKNGKTTLASLLLLLHLVGPEAKRNSELYSTGLSREQAAITYRLAAQMVRLSPVLKNLVDTRDTIKQLYCEDRGTTYTALSADASTAMGGSPVFVVHDELGQVVGERHRLYEALETGRGAHEESLSVVISTQAPTNADLLSVLIDDGLKDKTGRVKVFLWTAPEDADPFSEDTIKLANPAFGDFLDRASTLDDAGKAKRLPSREMEYRNLILNQRVSIDNVLITKTVWDRNNAEPESLTDSVYGGLDLSQTGDLTALVLLDSHGNVKCHFWLPEEGLIERSRTDRVPYDLWAKMGLITLCPGSAVDYDFVATHIAGLFKEYDIKKIAFDRFNMRHLKPCLYRAGLSEDFVETRFEDFGQGFVSMSPAIREMETLLLNEKLRHGGNEVLTMCCANAIVEMDAAGNRKMSKKKSTGRIDGMVSLAMACAMAAEDRNESHVYPVPPDQILEQAMEA